MLKAFAFTGTRLGLTPQQRASLERVLTQLRATGYTIAHNGSAIGADYEAGLLCHTLGFHIIAHPSTLVTQTSEIPYNERRDPVAPKTRDRVMVRESEILIGCPAGREQTKGSGTWYTIGYARRRNVPVVLVWPDGDVEGAV